MFCWCTLFSSSYYNFNLSLHFSLSCSRSIQFSLVILLLGVGIATVTDLQLNVLGSVLSLLAVITTCIAQIVSLMILGTVNKFDLIKYKFGHNFHNNQVFRPKFSKIYFLIIQLKSTYWRSRQCSSIKKTKQYHNRMNLIQTSLN